MGGTVTVSPVFYVVFFKNLAARQEKTKGFGNSQKFKNRKVTFDFLALASQIGSIFANYDFRD